MVGSRNNSIHSSKQSSPARSDGGTKFVRSSKDAHGVEGLNAINDADQCAEPLSPKINMEITHISSEEDNIGQENSDTGLITVL